MFCPNIYNQIPPRKYTTKEYLQLLERYLYGTTLKKSHIEDMRKIVEKRKIEYISKEMTKDLEINYDGDKTGCYYNHTIEIKEANGPKHTFSVIEYQPKLI